MKNQINLSPTELKVCALLYATSNSILFSDTTIIGWRGSGLYCCSIQKHFSLELSTDKATGWWNNHIFYTADNDIVQSLIDQKLLILHTGYDIGELRTRYKREFFTLNTEEFKEFFKELKVQIAIGSIT